MKWLLLLLILLCGYVPLAGPAPARVTFSSLTKAAYMQAKKGQLVTKPNFTFPLKKYKGRIVLPTGKRKRVFTDIVIDHTAVNKRHSESETVTHTYLGYLSAYQCHLIQVENYETSEWLLINDQGKSFSIYGEPQFSPDGRRIAAACMGIEYGGGQPNIVQILELQNGSLRKVWEVEPKTWEPSELSWVSSQELVLKKIMWTGKNPGASF